MSSSSWSPAPNSESSSISKTVQAITLLAASFSAAFRTEEIIAADTFNGSATATATLHQAERNSLVAAPVPQHVESVQDAVAKWAPGRQLFIRGDVGVSEDQLQALATWLAGHPHWIVYLDEQCQGAKYTDDEGRAHHHDKAVEFCLGHEVPNKTGFGSFTHPVTGQKDGNILFITFDAAREYRKVAYLSSAAYDDRGIGESQWEGNLNRTAIQHLRNGRRVLDAIQDTVRDIDVRLERTIQLEATQKEIAIQQAKREHELALESATRSIQEAGLQLGALPELVERFSTSHPGATGDLAHPELNRWKLNLEAAKSHLAKDELTEAGSIARQVTQDVSGHQRLLEYYGRDGHELESLDESIRLIETHRYVDAVKVPLTELREQYKEAQRRYGNGESTYPSHMETVRESIGAIEHKLSAIESSALLRQGLLTTFGLVALIGVMASAWVANRLRQGAKDTAENLLKSWKNALDEKLDVLFELDAKKNIFTDTASGRGASISGEEKRLADQIIHDVGNLFIMQCTARDVLQRAEAIIHPANIAQKLLNCFASGEYNRAIHLLRDEQIRFDPECQIAMVIRGPKEKELQLTGDLQDYAQFEMSYTELVAEFNRQGARAFGNLNRIETSREHSGELIARTEKALSLLTNRDSLLVEASNKDGHLTAKPLNGEVIPAISKLLTDSKAILKTDSVTAYDKAAAAEQILDAAGTLCDAVQSVRSSTESGLPRLIATRTQLESNGINVEWIDKDLKEIGKVLTRQMKQLVSAPDEKLAVTFLSRIAESAERLAVASELELNKRTKAEVQIQALSVRISDERTRIGSLLGVPADSVMREEGDDPSTHLEQSAAAISAMNSSLGIGDLEKSATLLASSKSHWNESEAIVAETLKALEQNPQTIASLRIRHAKLADEVPALTASVDTHAETFVRPALVFGAADEAHARAKYSVYDNLDQIQTHISESEALFAQADKLHGSARVLEAAALIRQADAQLASMHDRMTEIHEHLTLADTTAGLASDHSATLAIRLEKLTAGVNDDRTMNATIDQFELAGKDLKKAQDQLSLSQIHPFEISARLERCEQGIDRVTQMIRSDAELHKEAVRSVGAAEHVLEQARGLLTITAGDNIADSSAIERATAELPKLEKRFSVLHAIQSTRHGDWTFLDVEADAIFVAATTMSATLKREIAAAREAVNEIQAALTGIRAANSWVGSYGVGISGSPGSELLKVARQLIENGEYQKAQLKAEEAARMAERAIEKATQEVAAIRRRKQMEEAARVAAANAARSARSSSSSSSSSWTSSSSGFSSSSHTSSGSGFSSSNW